MVLNEYNLPHWYTKVLNNIMEIPWYMSRNTKKKNTVIKQYHISKSFVVLNISIIINNSTIESVILII